MKKFIELIEAVKTHGIVVKQRNMQYAVVVDASIKRDFFDKVEDSHPFVFMTHIDEDEAQEWDENGRPLTGASLQEALREAPFENFSLECAGDRPLITGKVKGSTDLILYHCIVVFRSVDGSYGETQLCNVTLALVSISTAPHQKFVTCSQNDWRPTLLCLQKLQREQMGVQQVRERVRIGQGKNKRIATIRQVVYVKPKNASAHSHAPSSHQINWSYSHRWEVMGHWRKISGVGKDSTGSYCVDGRTWVTPFVKGPESKPLIRKTRVIENVAR